MSNLLDNFGASREENLFVKPDEQSQTYLNFAMARKGLLIMNKIICYPEVPPKMSCKARQSI